MYLPTPTMSSYDLRGTVFRILFVFCLLYKNFSGVLPRLIPKAGLDKPPNSETFGKRASQCGWECRVLRFFHVASEMKAHITMGRIVVTELTVKRYVDDKCLSQTDVHNPSKLADAWVCSMVNTQTHERNVFLYSPKTDTPGTDSLVTDSPGSDSPKSDGSSNKLVIGQIKGTVACTFDPSTEQLYQFQNSSMIFSIANALTETTEASQLVQVINQCCREIEQNSFYHCETFCKIEEPVRALSVFIILVLVISIFYFPGVLCFFSPTHVRSIQNLDVIILDGPSHISIRGWVANFVSKVSLKLLDGHKHILIPILFLTTVAILSSSLVLYILITAGLNPGLKGMLIFFYFGGQLSMFACRFYSLINICIHCAMLTGEETFHEELKLVDTIKQHLRTQPLLIAKVWYFVRIFFNIYLQNLQNCGKKLKRRRWTTVFQFVGLLLVMPIALFVSLVVFLFVVLFFVIISYPFSMTVMHFYTISFIRNEKSKCLRVSRIVLNLHVLFSSLMGEVICLTILIPSFIKVVTTMLRLQNIPNLTLIILSTFYCSRCYYSFTIKYDDLAAKLYKFLKKRVQQGDNENALNLVKHYNNKAITKCIFDKACQETMPLAENICKLLVRVFIILTFFSLIYTIVIKTPGVPDRMKITATFLVAVMPMITEIMMLKKGDEMKKLRQEELDEKIQSIVEEYYQSNLREERENVEMAPESSTSSLYYSAIDIVYLNEINE